MKYCSHCGNELDDEAYVCPKCGYKAATTGSTSKLATDSKSTIRFIAKIFMIIGCISVGWTLIPLIWCIPMTISYWKACDENRDVSVAFKVCSLLFVNLIAGILMLCDSIED